MRILAIVVACGWSCLFGGLLQFNKRELILGVILAVTAVASLVLCALSLGA